MTTTQTQQTLTVHAIDPARLDAVRAAGPTSSATRSRAYDATGEGEPLRCCLRFARPGRADRPHLVGAVRRRCRCGAEVGPVYVHAERCAGYAGEPEFPPG